MTGGASTTCEIFNKKTIPIQLPAGHRLTYLLPVTWEVPFEWGHLQITMHAFSISETFCIDGKVFRIMTYNQERQKRNQLDGQLGKQPGCTSDSSAAGVPQLAAKCA